MPAGSRRTIKNFKPRPPVDNEEELVDFSQLREDYKRHREWFCREYIKDFNASNAVRRMGSNSKKPAIRGSELLSCPYTQYYLRQLLDKLDEKAIITRNEILIGLKREAHADNSLFASSASRISALRSLAKILGMEITKVEGNMKLDGGVMMIPCTGTLEEWEAQSKAAQAKLKQDVRT